MTKKDITETTVIIILLTVLTISFINPFSKKYTIWNLVYQTQDLYNWAIKEFVKVRIDLAFTITRHIALK